MSQAKAKSKGNRKGKSTGDEFVEDGRVFSLPFVNPRAFDHPNIKGMKFPEWWSAPYREYEHEGQPIGRAFFEEWARLARSNRAHAVTALRFALERMVSKGRMLAVEAGFLACLAETAAVGARNGGRSAR